MEQIFGLFLLSLFGSYSIFKNSQHSLGFQSGGGDPPSTLYIFLGHGFESTLPAIDLTVSDPAIIMLANEGCTLIDTHEEYGPGRLRKLMKESQEIDLLLQDLHGIDRANTFAVYKETKVPNLILSTCRLGFELTGLYRLQNGQKAELIELKKEFMKLEDLIKFIVTLEKNSDFLLDLYCCRETLNKFASTRYCYPDFNNFLILNKIPIVEKLIDNYPAEPLSEWYEKTYQKIIHKTLPQSDDDKNPEKHPIPEPSKVDLDNMKKIQIIYDILKEKLPPKTFVRRQKISELLKQGLSEDQVITQYLE